METVRISLFAKTVWRDARRRLIRNVHIDSY